MFRRAMAERPELPALLDATAQGRRRTLLAPKLSAEARVRLGRAENLTVLVISDVLWLSNDGRLELEVHEPRHGIGKPRLSVDLRDRTVYVDGEQKRLPPSSRKLLRLLLEAWESGRSVPAAVIEREFSSRAAKNVVWQLKKDLSRGLPNSTEIGGWIQKEHGNTAYRLQLPRELVKIQS